MLNNFLKWLGIRNQFELHNVKQRIAILYAILGWNCFAVYFYMLIKKHTPDDRVEQRKTYQKLTGTSPMTHVYQIKGLKLTNDFESMVQEDEETTRIDENI